MSSAPVFQHVVHSRRVALSVADGLARALRLRGAFPPLIGDISCDVVRQTVPVVRTFTPPLELTSFRNASGFLILDGTYRASAADGRTFPLGAGTYVARVRGDYYQAREFPLNWPPPDGQTRIPSIAPTHLELLPAPGYPLPDLTATRHQLGPTILRGTLFTASGEPIAGATVEVINLPPFLAPAELPPLAAADWQFARAVTSERGDWALVLPGRRYLHNAPEELPANTVVTTNLTLRLTFPDGSTVNLQRTVELGREFTLKTTALRGQVVGGAGQPIAGAVVTTSVNARTSVSRANGLWFLYFDFDQLTVNGVTVTVTTLGGASASDAAVQIRHDATVVVPTFRFS